MKKHEHDINTRIIRSNFGSFNREKIGEKKREEKKSI